MPARREERPVAPLPQLCSGRAASTRLGRWRWRPSPSQVAVATGSPSAQPFPPSAPDAPHKPLVCRFPTVAASLRPALWTTRSLSCGRSQPCCSLSTPFCASRSLARHSVVTSVEGQRGSAQCGQRIGRTDGRSVDRGARCGLRGRAVVAEDSFSCCLTSSCLYLASSEAGAPPAR